MNTPTPMPGTAGEREAVLPLPNYLRALASDCEWTDGWEAAADDLIEAAAEIETSRATIAALLSALEGLLEATGQTRPEPYEDAGDGPFAAARAAIASARHD